MPVARDGRNRARHKFDVLFLERSVEGARDDRPLAGIGILRRHRLPQIWPIGELPVDVRAAELLARGVGLGAGPVEVPAPQALLQHVPLPPPFSPARRTFVVGQVALALGHDPSRFALEHVALLHDRLDRRHHLRRGGTGADHGNDLAGEVVLVFPARSVERGPVEVVEPGPVGVAGHVEEADRAHEDVECPDGPIAEAKHPTVVPGRRLHRHPESQVRT